MSRIVILGAGLAGLSAAYSLSQAGHLVTIIEKEATPGGLCRTFDFKGCRFDIGPHIFFIKRSAEIAAFLQELGQAKLRAIRPVDGILYNDRFYPSLLDVLLDLNVIDKVQAVSALILRRMFPRHRVVSDEDRLVNTYGHWIYATVVKGHQYKFLGFDSSQIDLTWRRDDKKPTPLLTHLRAELVRRLNRDYPNGPVETYYPSGGSRTIYEELQSRIDRSPITSFSFNCEVVTINQANHTVRSIEVRDQAAKTTRTIFGSQFISTIPVTELIRKMHPPPPKEILGIVDSFRYRQLVLANLIVDLARPFPYSWVEVHSTHLQSGRITNFAELCNEMGSGDERVPICLEYYCFEDDDLWRMKDDEVLSLANNELRAMGLIRPGQVCEGFVKRLRYAYPIHLLGCSQLRIRLKEYLRQFSNLQSIGRGGIHRYNNMGHSIESGLWAADNLLNGKSHDLWDRNVNDAGQGYSAGSI